MSCRSCGLTRCLRRCGTGWPPPSPSRPGPKAAEQRRSPSSGASCTRCRLGSSWNGEAHPRPASFYPWLCPSFPATLVFQDPTVPPAPHAHGLSTQPRLIRPHSQTSHLGSFSFFSLRMFRRTYTSVGPTYSTVVLNCLKVIPGVSGKRRSLEGGGTVLGTFRRFTG